MRHESRLKGVEKQDIRIGGLLKRIRRCRKILEGYAAGKIKKYHRCRKKFCRMRALQTVWRYCLITGYSYDQIDNVSVEKRKAFKELIER